MILGCGCLLRGLHSFLAEYFQTTTGVNLCPPNQQTSKNTPLSQALQGVNIPDWLIADVCRRVAITPCFEQSQFVSYCLQQYGSVAGFNTSLPPALGLLIRCDQFPESCSMVRVICFDGASLKLELSGFIALVSRLWG